MKSGAPDLVSISCHTSATRHLQMSEYVNVKIVVYQYWSHNRDVVLFTLGHCKVNLLTKRKAAQISAQTIY